MSPGNIHFPFLPEGGRVGFELPMPEDGSESPYLPSPPKRLRVKESDVSKTMNFSAREAGARIEGVVYGPSGNPVSNLDLGFMPVSIQLIKKMSF